MEFDKTLLFLMINLMILDFSLAHPTNVSISKSVGPENLKYTEFPFGIMFSESGKTVEISQKEASKYDVKEDGNDGNKLRAVYWIPMTCDSFAERGYTCLACGESLHCMGGNFALKAICGSRRPFCNNGVCSNIRGEKCRSNQDHAHSSAATHAADDEQELENINDETNATMTDDN